MEDDVFFKLLDELLYFNYRCKWIWVLTHSSSLTTKFLKNLSYQASRYFWNMYHHCLYCGREIYNAGSVGDILATECGTANFRVFLCYIQRVWVMLLLCKHFFFPVYNTRMLKHYCCKSLKCCLQVKLFQSSPEGKENKYSLNLHSNYISH